MTPGRLVYLLYYRQLAAWRKMRKAGVIVTVLSAIGRLQMKIKAAALKEISREGLPVIEVYFLTGKKYWYQTAFCLYSLQMNLSSVHVNGVFVDDGTFDPSLIRKMKKQFPGSTARTAAESDRLVGQLLPVANYPLLNKKRKNYPHIRKLTDAHAGSPGWKMVLDSDMLFFRYPGAIERWLMQPERPFFLYDPVCSYHYTPAIMDRLAGHAVTPHLNVGVIGLKSSAISWEKLERWIGELEAAEGDHYFLEQALSAMIASGSEITVASAQEYIVMPDKHEAQHPAGILHHYVAGSKNWYYQYAWKRIL